MKMASARGRTTRINWKELSLYICTFFIFKCISPSFSFHRCSWLVVGIKYPRLMIQLSMPRNMKTSLLYEDSISYILYIEMHVKLVRQRYLHYFKHNAHSYSDACEISRWKNASLLWSKGQIREINIRTKNIIYPAAINKERGAARREATLSTKFTFTH